MGMTPEHIKRVRHTVNRFMEWLTQHGEYSYDHQSFFSGPLGRKAKEVYYKHRIAGTLAVAPMIFLEAFIPEGRRFFGKPLRFPIADAHYAMGFALLACLDPGKDFDERAVHFLEKLQKSRSPGYRYYCWGYPFGWVTRNGTIPAHTPFITTLPYAYEAFDYVHQLDKSDQWLEVMQSIAEHAIKDIKDFEVSPGAFSCGYGPYDDRGGVVNASAYRAFLLTGAHRQFSEERYRRAAEGNIQFVLGAQRDDGSWPYAVGDERDFVDHFHTCFVLKALAKIERLTAHEGCKKAINKGVEYYLENLIDADGLPKPFSVAPRMTVYKRELYDYAECTNLCILLRDRISELQGTLETVIKDIFSRWIKKDGSFRSRELLLGWDNVPMHRWAQSQMFRSLCLLLCEESKKETAQQDTK